MSTQITLAPESVESTGIRRSLLEDLAVKTLYMHGELTLLELARVMHLGLGVVEDLFQRLRREQLCEVRGMTGGVHRIAPTGLGRDRALDLLSQNQYVGPAPVSLTDYVARVREQGVRGAAVHPGDVEASLQHLVLGPQTVKQVGTAVVSGTSIFLYGPPGTGKTSVAEALPRIYRDHVWVPYAVEVDGQIITIFDPTVHRTADAPESDEDDRRWVLCERPCILTGGELTSQMLDLQFNALTRFYDAPLQMKANNGVLVIDDFGRQKVRPDELLNRWIVPLDRGMDFLTLGGGKKFEIPFDLLVVFATNLDPKGLADEAFLRRIPNKIKLDAVTRQQFVEIFRRGCGQFDVPYNEHVVTEMVELLTKELKQPLRPCYARDILRQITWEARYEGKLPKLDRFSVVRACGTYFLAS